MLQGCDAVVNHLSLRDYLRSHPEAVEEYGALKVGDSHGLPLPLGGVREEYERRSRKGR